MPLYDYRCDTCDNLEERLEKSDAPTERPCGCGKGVLHRAISGPAQFDLKGSGWYKPGVS